MRRTTPAGIVMVLIAVMWASAGCSSTDASDVPTTSSTTPNVESAKAPAPDGPEVGTWTTGPVPLVEFERAIARAGFEKDVDTFSDDVHRAKAMALALTLRDGFITLSYAPDGGAGQIADRGTYERDGRHLVVTNGSGTNVLAFRIEDDQLVLHLVSTTEPNYAGAPAAMFQTAWYETTPFTRAPS